MRAPAPRRPVRRGRLPRSAAVRLPRSAEGARLAQGAAAQIDEGGPILYADAAGGDRDIVLQHLGDDPDSGWLAFAARPGGVSRECSIQWQAGPSGDPSDGVFLLLDGSGDETQACDGREFPADGEGLAQYPVTVADNRLDVDLNAADRASTTTAG